ncbi:MAG: cation diffusion facilitator family transporter [Acidimicrobiia bacterium]
MTPAPPSDDTRRALTLQYATVAWNVGEAFLTIGLGAVAGSLALIAFGTSSMVEVFASFVVIWHLKPTAGVDHAARTSRALKLVAGAFLLLAVALGASAIRDLASGREAGESWWGVAYLAVTAVVMFGLSIAKRKVARRLNSGPLESEATMTFLDGILSVSTLTGLALNAAFGLWWADPAVALIVALFALNEARENWEEAREVGQVDSERE